MYGWMISGLLYTHIRVWERNVFSKDTQRLRSEEAVMSEVCDLTSSLQVKVVMAVIC